MSENNRKIRLAIVTALLSALAILLAITGKQNKKNVADIDDRFPRKESGGNRNSKGGNFYRIYVKRILDIILAFIGLILLAPVYGVIALFIMIDDPGPVFFKQKRVGKDKKYFMLHKFRTMKTITPHDVPTHLLDNPDQYITRMGRFLRKSSLDELPQIWDIFIGNMSIIGPRPALWNQEDLVNERDKYGANNVVPGLTGWAQINGRDELEISQKAKLDGEYAEKLFQGGIKAFAFDLKCFLGTISSVLNAEGVVEGGTGELQKSAEQKKEAFGLSILAEAISVQASPGVKKKIIIVGKNSYIGTKVKDFLNNSKEDYEAEELDVLTDEWRSFDFTPYDVVFQVAGIAHQKETEANAHLYYSVNRDLAVEVAERAKKAGVKQYIYMSSMSVYGLIESSNAIDLTTNVNPNTNYGWSKFQAEERLSELAEEGFIVTLLRPPMVYGDDAPGNLTQLFGAVRKLHVFPNIKNERSAISVENLCEAVKYVIDANVSGVVIPQDSRYLCTVDIVKEQMKKEGVKVIYTPVFNPMIRMLIGRVTIVTKAFGNLRYQMQ